MGDIVGLLLLLLLGGIALIGLLVWVLKVSSEARLQAKQLAERVERLEQAIAAGGLTARPLPPPPAPKPQPAPAPPLPAIPPPAPVIVPPRPSAPPPGPTPAPAMSVSQVEEWIGSVWLQNAGSVLVLVGVFFLILWGYSTGRLGPGVLVAAGVFMGLGFLWRGDRVTRTTPAFGHALLGIGVGIVYLSIYVGHVQLGVLPRAVALILLVLVSIGSIVLGLRYRVQTIAVLGVIGAFVPLLLGAWIPLAGFKLAPDTMLGYLAAVGIAVYALSARAGWSFLDLTMLFLATITWSSAVYGSSWAWHTEIGLALLYATFGLAPLPALVRRPSPPRAVDLAVISFAPLLFVLVSLPFATGASRQGIAALSLALSALYTGAAWWTDSVRKERDLWRPLTAAATLFLTLGLARAVGDESTAMAWSLEGVILVAIGLRSGSAWLRACGTVVMGIAAISLAVRLGQNWSSVTAPAFVSPYAIRDLAGIACLLVASHILGRERERLTADERPLAEIWTLLGNSALAVWIGREFSTLALQTMTTQEDKWAPTWSALAWSAQVAILLWRGLQRRPTLRWTAYLGAGLILVTGLGFLIWLSVQRSHQPILALWLVVLATQLFLADRLASRNELDIADRGVAEVWTLLGHVVLAVWISREFSTLALQTMPTQADKWAPTWSALAWSAQVALLLWRGWQRRPTLRWAAYAGAGLILASGLWFLIWLAGQASDPSILALWVVGLATHMFLADRLSSRRDKLDNAERFLPEIWTLGIVIVWMAWTARAAGLIADATGDARHESVLRAALTSAAWLVEAAVLTILGWTKKSAFLRWTGLALFGWTVLKILLMDLTRVDVFWRFLSAVLAGVALLAVSYAYQRKRRLEAAQSPPVPDRAS